MAVDVRCLATPLGTESSRDLVPLARHTLDDFLRHRRVVFAAFKTFVEQFDPEVGNFLTRALGDLFLNFAAPVLNIGNCGWQNGSGLFQLFVAHRLSPLSYANDFDQIMCGHGAARFAAEDVVETRKSTPLVIQPIVVKHWVTDSPPGETIDDNVELVLGRAFGRRPVPGDYALVEPLHLIDERQLHLQPRGGDCANDFAEPRDDHRLVLVHHEEQRSPFQCGQNEKNAQDRH
ncbi:MAG: hypothetical protein Udaeo_12360 [Candidatus Udaeobacter sp.]|nr:MAG: hypothetical protein Udaeo_12360 [Candidatus Udaeobacter sp.]